MEDNREVSPTTPSPIDPICDDSESGKISEASAAIIVHSADDKGSGLEQLQSSDRDDIQMELVPNLCNISIGQPLSLNDSTFGDNEQPTVEQETAVSRKQTETREIVSTSSVPIQPQLDEQSKPSRKSIEAKGNDSNDDETNANNEKNTNNIDSFARNPLPNQTVAMLSQNHSNGNSDSESDQTCDEILIPMVDEEEQLSSSDRPSSLHNTAIIDNENDKQELSVPLNQTRKRKHVSSVEYNFRKSSKVANDIEADASNESNKNNISSAAHLLRLPVAKTSTAKKQIAAKRPTLPKQKSQPKSQPIQPKLNQKFNAQREIIFLEQTTHLLMQHKPFVRLVRQTMQQDTHHNAEQYKITGEAMDALHQSAELYLVQLFEDSYRCTRHRGRMTLSVKDMKLMLKLRGSNDAGNK